MVNYHGEDRFEVREAPFRYEAGTPNIEGAIGLGAAIEYVRAIGIDKIAAHSRALGEQLVAGLRALPGARVLGAHVPPERRVALCTLSLPVPSMTQANIARLLADSHAILVSGGYHCAHVLHHRAAARRHAARQRAPVQRRGRRGEIAEGAARAVIEHKGSKVMKGRKTESELFLLAPLPC